MYVCMCFRSLTGSFLVQTQLAEGSMAEQRNSSKRSLIWYIELQNKWEWNMWRHWSENAFNPRALRRWRLVGSSSVCLPAYPPVTGNSLNHYFPSQRHPGQTHIVSKRHISTYKAIQCLACFGPYSTLTLIHDVLHTIWKLCFVQHIFCSIRNCHTRQPGDQSCQQLLLWIVPTVFLLTSREQQVMHIFNCLSLQFYLLTP